MTNDGLLVTELSAGYGRAQVITEITFSVQPQAWHALLGPNGAGKTSLMKVLSGHLRPFSGSVRWNGTDLLVTEPYRLVGHGVALVPEGRRVYGGMSIRENLLVGAHGSARVLRNERLDQVLTTFPFLAQRRNQLAGTLSGGQQQLCAIGRALMSAPSLLLIDELTLGLSPAAIAEVVGHLQEIRMSYDITVLLVDQDIRVAEQLVEWGYFLDQGRIAANGPVERLLDAELVKQLYLSAAPTDGQSPA